MCSKHAQGLLEKCQYPTCFLLEHGNPNHINSTCLALFFWFLKKKILYLLKLVFDLILLRNLDKTSTFGVRAESRTKKEECQLQSMTLRNSMAEMTSSCGRWIWRPFWFNRALKKLYCLIKIFQKVWLKRKCKNFKERLTARSY